MKIEFFPQSYHFDGIEDIVDMLKNSNCKFGSPFDPRFDPFNFLYYQNFSEIAKKVRMYFHFSYPRGKKFSFALVTIETTATTNEVLEEMNRNGLRPAKTEHLLIFSRHYLKDVPWQENGSIIALGSPTAEPQTKKIEFPAIDWDHYFLHYSKCNAPVFNLDRPGDNGWYKYEYCTYRRSFLAIKED